MRFTCGITARRRSDQRPTQHKIGQLAALWLGALALLLNLLVWAAATPVIVKVGGMVQLVCTVAGMQAVEGAGDPRADGEGAAKLRVCPLCPLLAGLDLPPPALILMPPVAQRALPLSLTPDLPSGKPFAAPRARGPPLFA